MEATLRRDEIRKQLMVQEPKVHAIRTSIEKKLAAVR
jgi:hypothetical protein